MVPPPQAAAAQTATAAAPSATAPGTTNPFAQQAQAVADAGQYEATTGTFDEEKGVEGRVASISSKGGPLMQLAQTRALQAANARGLSNSSMAVGAAQNAVLDAAMPIAQSDAAAFQQQQLQNQSALNAASSQNAQVRAQAGTEGMRLGESARQADAAEAGVNNRFNAGEQNAQSRFNAEQQNTLMRQAMDQQFRATQAQLDRDQQVAMEELRGQWDMEIQANEKLSGAWGTMMDSINQIQMNPDLDAETKKTLVENTLAQFNAYATWSSKVSGVDVGDLLNFGTAAPAPPAAGGAAPAPGAAPSPSPAPSPAPKPPGINPNGSPAANAAAIRAWEREMQGQS